MISCCLFVVVLNFFTFTYLFVSLSVSLLEKIGGTGPQEQNFLQAQAGVSFITKGRLSKDNEAIYWSGFLARHELFPILVVCFDYVVLQARVKAKAFKFVAVRKKLASGCGLWHPGGQQPRCIPGVLVCFCIVSSIIY